MFEAEIFVFEGSIIYRISSLSISICDITSLYHKVTNNSMERRALVMEQNSITVLTKLARTESLKIVASFGAFFVE